MGIQCSDAGLQAAIASIKTDNGPTGMWNNFKDVAAQFLPYKPVAIKRTMGAKCGAGLISAMEPAQVNRIEGMKPSMGKWECTFSTINTVIQGAYSRTAKGFE